MNVHLEVHFLCFRYAVSVIWELDSKYEVVDVWYGKTIIRSQYKLFYEVSVNKNAVFVIVQ